MAIAVRNKRLRLATAIAFFLASVVNAFGHSLPVRAAVPVDYSAYALPDGTVPVICSVGGEDDSATPSTKGCEACRLTVAPGLDNPPCGTLGTPVHYVSVTYQARETSFRTQALTTSSRQRAPPS